MGGCLFVLGEKFLGALQALHLFSKGGGGDGGGGSSSSGVGGGGKLQRVWAESEWWLLGEVGKVSLGGQSQPLPAGSSSNAATAAAVAASRLQRCQERERAAAAAAALRVLIAQAEGKGQHHTNACVEGEGDFGWVCGGLVVG